MTLSNAMPNLTNAQALVRYVDRFPTMMLRLGDDDIGMIGNAIRNDRANQQQPRGRYGCRYNCTMATMAEGATMQTELFRRCGQSLYGRQWHTTMAEALGINITTIRRWANGDQVIPQFVPERLLMLFDERIEELGNRASELKEATGLRRK